MKAAEKLFEKDVDRGLELKETLTENGQGNIRLGTSKAESEAFEANKVREVIEMNNKQGERIQKLESEMKRLREVNSYLNKENKGFV